MISSKADKRRVCASHEHLGRPLVVGIAGGTGSGKTTLARAIVDAFGDSKVAYISHDSYYRDISHLSLEERARSNFDHPASLESSLLVDHLTSLRNNESASVPVYDFSTHARTPDVEIVEPKPIIVVEGILIFAEPALVDVLDIKIFVDADDDIRFIRRLQRDTIERGRTQESVIQQYLTTVRSMHAAFVLPSKKHADVVVLGGRNSVALDLIISRLWHFMKGD